MAANYPTPEATGAEAFADFRPARKMTRGETMEAGAFWFLIAVLAWAPFPLGSNRPWSWSLMAILIAICAALWFASGALQRVDRQVWRALRLPLVLIAIVLFWCLVQCLPGIALGPAAAIWREASAILGAPLSESISLDPWRSTGEAMKLAAYAMAAWLACTMCRQPERAAQLLSSLIVIGALYAIYALVLDLRGVLQFEFFYPEPAFGSYGAGPFVNRNSYATFAGLVALCAGARIIDVASWSVVVGQGIRQFLLSFAQFLVGPGAIAVLSGFLALSTLVASGSRAGFASALAGLFALIVAAALSQARQFSLVRMIAIACGFAAAILAVLFFSGDMLLRNLDNTVEAGGGLELRAALWSAAMKMIAAAPLTGFGLGTYEHAYPFYAQELLRFTMDKAHNDYLEFAAGVGIPAALLWWIAMLWLIGMCARAVFIRRRDRAYPLLALAASALVGFHALFDFSLQIPAVALWYAAILGLGVAQSFSTRGT